MKKIGHDTHDIAKICPDKFLNEFALQDVAQLSRYEILQILSAYETKYRKYTPI